MIVIRSPRAMTAWSERLRREGLTIGFVPTMGALHHGHRSLIRAARLRCDALVVSIFVNPTQFAPKEDLATYPRPIVRDRALCRAEGVDVCFEPGASVMYPEGFQTTVTVPRIARRWEGEARPHHFAGVATVVTKLFGIVRPTLAVFGQKDYQQAAVVRQLIDDLNVGVTLDVRETIREPDGLAMSSRNVYLSPDQRSTATVLHRALSAGEQAIRNGARAGKEVERLMKDVVESVSSVQIEYLAVCDAVTLDPLETIDHPVVLLGAIRIGSVRLIDNIVVKIPQKRRK
ncbi:MAG TPA: pantoate--beta-alanine ligase [Nitrospira sp.]